MAIRKDLLLLRPALLIATALLLAGALVATLAHFWWVDQEDSHRQAREARRNIQIRLARIDEEEGEIRAGGVLFDKLVARGIVGEEQRMEWIARIQHIRSERRLFDIHWELQARRLLEADIAPGEGGEYAMQASRLKISMPLLHEEDLLRFLDDLREGAQAYVRPQHCLINGTPTANPVDQAAASTLQPQLQAECDMDFITLSSPSAAKPAVSTKP